MTEREARVIRAAMAHVAVTGATWGALYEAVAALPEGYDPSAGPTVDVTITLDDALQSMVKSIREQARAKHLSEESAREILAHLNAHGAGLSADAEGNLRAEHHRDIQQGDQARKPQGES